ncbi:MAG: Gfo/Idh/MocA family oxidoreductase [Alphaproteobacteria bacterium]|nr:Gfo/Idh/MocA family oxidoreductase [Alphaproteobacteria bacterium]
MTDGALGIGIIGAGWWGGQHARAIARAEGVRLVAACRGDGGVEDFVAAHGGTAHRSVEGVLADRAVDAVVVATPHHLHEAHAIAAARAGKHILLEKPMAPGTAACSRIIAAARATGVVLVLGHSLRFAAPLAAAKAWLDGGEFGAVRFARGAMIKLWMEANRRPWHLEPASGGGLLLTAGIHTLDAVLWLVGAPVRDVHAVVATGFHPMRVDDLAQLTLRFEGGAIGSVTSVGYRDGAPSGGIDLVCERGTIAIDPGRGVRLGQAAKWRDLPMALPADVPGQALVEEWRAFARAVRGEAAPAVDGEAGRRVVACIEAAFESARRGVTVEVAP